MSDSGNTYLHILNEQLAATGDPVAGDLARVAGQIGAVAYGESGQPLRAMVFDPLLEQAVYCAETLLDVLDHPPLGATPATSSTCVVPAADIAVLHGAEAILRLRGLAGDAQLANLLAQARLHGHAPAGQDSLADAWVLTALAAARALTEAGAGARLGIPTPRDGGKNADTA